MTTHEIVALSTTVPVKLTEGQTHSGMDITIQNINATGYVYVGGDDVSTTDYGFRILPNHSISFELSGKDTLYVVSSAGGMSAAVIKIGLETE